MRAVDVHVLVLDEIPNILAGTFKEAADRAQYAEVPEQ